MIRIVDDIEEKQRIARSILTALPEWFGIPESTENYIRESANEIMVASFEEEKANGFLCLKETGKDTVELAVMGVLKTHHRKGIGRDMYSLLDDRQFRMHGLGRNTSARPTPFGRWLSAFP